MRKFKIALGDKIELLPLLPDGSYSDTCLVSQIQEILSENDFCILPLDEEHPAKWIDHFFQLTVIRKNQIYVSVVQVVGCEKENSLIFLRLRVLENFAPKQRRSHFRLKVYLKVEIPGYGKYKTVDLSGSGLAFISDKKIPEDEQLDINLNLAGIKMNFTGIVLRSFDISRNVSEKRFLTSIEFQDIEKADQNELLKYIYAQQVIMIKKGILTSEND